MKTNFKFNRKVTVYPYALEGIKSNDDKRKIKLALKFVKSILTLERSELEQHDITYHGKFNGKNDYVYTGYCFKGNMYDVMQLMNCDDIKLAFEVLHIVKNMKINTKNQMPYPFHITALSPNYVEISFLPPYQWQKDFIAGKSNESIRFEFNDEHYETFENAFDRMEPVIKADQTVQNEKFITHALELGRIILGNKEYDLLKIEICESDNLLRATKVEEFEDIRGTGKFSVRAKVTYEPKLLMDIMGFELSYDLRTTVHILSVMHVKVKNRKWWQPIYVSAAPRGEFGHTDSEGYFGDDFNFEFCYEHESSELNTDEMKKWQNDFSKGKYVEGIEFKNFMFGAYANWGFN